MPPGAKMPSLFCFTVLQFTVLQFAAGQMDVFGLQAGNLILATPADNAFFFRKKTGRVRRKWEG